MSLRITAGLFKGRKVFFPKKEAIRPTQAALREAFFNIVQNEIEGAHFLDIFSGSGIMGLEALSRGAFSTTFIEKDRSSIEGIRKTLTSWNLIEKATLVCQDANKAVSFLGRKNRLFQLIFLDPPYKMEVEKKKSLLSQIIKEALLDKEGSLFLEESSSSKEEYAIEGLSLKTKRKWGSSSLLAFQSCM